MPVEPHPVNGRPCISKNETMFLSNAGLLLNCSTRLNRTSGANVSVFCRSKSTSSYNARCSAVWPRLSSAAITLASVFHSLVFSSLLRSWSTAVGRVPSDSTRTLSFFFILLGPFELPGEEIIHHQRCDKSSHPKILLRIIVQDMELEFVATIDHSAKE